MRGINRCVLTTSAWLIIGGQNEPDTRFHSLGDSCGSFYFDHFRVAFRIREKSGSWGGGPRSAPQTLQEFIIRSNCTSGLQAMGKENAQKKLTTMAKHDDGVGVIALCRMLFLEKSPTTFRAPLLGEPVCVGKTDPSCWPLVPIEVIDDIPFLVVKGYKLSGVPESPSHYLNYCLENCAWREKPYESVSKAAAKAALEKLLASKKWENKLSESDRSYLRSQIEDEQK